MTLNELKQKQIERFDEKFSSIEYMDDENGFELSADDDVRNFLQSCQQEIIQHFREEIEEDYIKHLLEPKCEGNHLLDWAALKERAEVEDLKRWS